jgi:hypothetical protein
VSEQWYRIALADADGTRLVVAPGEHLGQAIELARARAGRGDADAVWPIAAEPAKPGEVPLGESVGKGVVVERPDELAASVPVFRWPSGVLPTLEGARQLGRPVEGHERSQHGEIQAVEAVLAGDRLVEVFLQIVELLPAADNVEVKVTGHHDQAGTTEVWLSPRLPDVNKAIRFLDDHDVELLGNGHVEVAVYLRKQRSTLRLTEHKTILWLTEEPGLADTFVSWLEARGAPAVAALPHVKAVDHYHWRPTASRVRKKLLQHLHRLRLRKVDSWQDAA